MKAVSASQAVSLYGEAKRKNYAFQQFLVGSDRPDWQDLGKLLMVCASWLHLREWLETGDSKLVKANFCKRHLVCRPCAVRRGARYLAVYLQRVAAVMEERKNLKAGLLTLTVRNGEDLKERFQHLGDAWRIMSKHSSRVKKGGWGKSELAKIAGGVRACEVTCGVGGWHPHYHAFVLLEDYLDQRKLSEEWERITGDSYIVGIQRVRGDIFNGLSEIFKYALKFSDLKNEQLIHAFEVLGGRRMLNSWGCFWGVKEPDLDSDDDLDQLGEYRDFVARWSWSNLAYSIDFQPHTKTKL